MATVINKSGLLKGLWILHGIIQFSLCAEMYLGMYDYTDQYVYVKITLHSHNTRFYKCMKDYRSQKCILLLTDYFYVYYVLQQLFSNPNEQTTLTSICSLKKNCNFNGRRDSQRCVVCTKADYGQYFCDGIDCAGSKLFQIWHAENENITDDELTNCRNATRCSAYFKKTTTLSETSKTVTSGITFVITSNQTTPSSNNETTNYNGAASQNNTATLPSNNFPNTSTIIISVAVCVCLVVVIVVIVYCIRKKSILKNKQQNQVIFGNDISTSENKNNIAVLNDKTKTVTLNVKSNAHLNDSYLHTYDEYDASCSSQTNNCNAGISGTDSIKHIKENNAHIKQNEKVAIQQMGVYQNVNPATDTSLTKPYARLGEHKKVVEHDYNILLPEEKDKSGTKENFLDSNPTHGTVATTYNTLTKPYARLGEHVKVVEHDYNCLAPEQRGNKDNIIDTYLKSNPTDTTNTDLTEYSMAASAQICVTGDSSSPYLLANIVEP